jgi:hypothetical protein
VKAQRIRWLGHVERMSEEQMPKIMFQGRLFSRRRKGRPRTRWLHNVVMGVRGWRGRVGDSRLEESCEGSQSPPRAVVLLLLMMMMIRSVTRLTLHVGDEGENYIQFLVGNAE